MKQETRPLFKILAFIIGVLCFIFGILNGVLFFKGEMILFNNSFTEAVTFLLNGAVFLTFAISRNASIRGKKNTLLRGEKPGRFALLLELFLYIAVVSLIVLIFSHNQWTTFWWWVGIFICLGLLFRFFTVSYIMLTSLGYNPWLAITVVLPIYLMVKLTVNPDK